MELGTVEPLSEDREVRKRKTRIGTGTGGGRRGGGNGGGSNGGDNHDNDLEDQQSGVPDKAKVVTWFLLLVVLMTFGGLFGAYIVIATNGAAEWKPFSLPVQVWISTALIFISSITYHLGKIAVDAEDGARARKWMVITTVFGAAFISSQLLAWLALVNRGLYMTGNPYAGFFYLLTAVHAVHVLGGIIALGAILLRVWNDTSHGPELTYRRHLARSVGWYWHFMGVLWLVLFVLLGFWK